MATATFGVESVDETNKAEGRVLVYRSASGNLEYEVPGGGGGSTPQIYYAQGADTSNLGTSLGTIDWATAVFSDPGYTESAGTITIGSALNGKRARVDWHLDCTDGSNRVELYTELQVNGVAQSVASNYSARNSTYNMGGCGSFLYLTLTTDDEIRLRARRSGSTANKAQNGTMLSIETKS